MGFLLKGTPMNILSWLRAQGHLPFFALREKFRHGYNKSDFAADLSAGVVVGLVAIPLGLALAIATGVPPQHGLYTIIFAGFLVALLGGSRTQVTGPTAAFVVILVPIVSKFGVTGLLTAGFMAGVLLMAMGALRLGRVIRIVPSPVVTGFTAGIAVVIATIQLKDFFGLTVEHMPESYVGKVGALLHAVPSLAWPEALLGAVSLVALLVVPKFIKKFPAPLVVLPVATIAVYFLNKFSPEVAMDTIGSRFSFHDGERVVNGIPSVFPSFAAPWSGGGTPFSFEMLRELFPSALAIALLGAIESLLSAVVADGMARTRHNPDSELLALGVGNVVAPFFGGIPATGAIARTATNVRFGARSPISAIVHALFSLLAVLVFSKVLSFIPMAAMAALLLVVAYNMSEIHYFIRVVRSAPRYDVAVLFICFLTTVLTDMVVGVAVGMGLAAFLFVVRIGQVSHGKFFAQGARHHDLNEPVPPGVMVYDIDGAMFFGAARLATDTLLSIENDLKVFVIAMDDVLVVDYSGCLHLKVMLDEIFAKKDVTVVFAGLRPETRSVLEKAGLLSPRVKIGETLSEAIRIAREQFPAIV